VSCLDTPEHDTKLQHGKVVLRWNMTDPTEQLMIIASIKDLFSRLGENASPEDQAIIADIMGKLTDLEYSLMP